METIENTILKSIKSRPKGSILLPKDFSKFGNSTAVRKSLQRLNDSGAIKRISQGIYYRPKFNEFIGELTPSVDEVIKEIAKRDKIKIIPTGSYALYVLGFTTQIPLNFIFITNGSARKLTIGKQTITFKKTTPKNLMMKDEITMLITQALRELGKDNISNEISKKIKAILSKEQPKHIEHDINLAPEWIKQTIKRAIHESIL